MQDDLDDGVKWLVEQGKVDPKRVCIMGASYGGYAAMWGAARNPEIYRCAISFAGISDLAAMIRYDRKSFSATRYFRAWREKVQGDKSFDLDTVSPLYSVAKISVPLLIAHGDQDDNVPVSQSKKLHEALSKANKAHEFVVYEGEGHGLQNPEHAAGFLKRVEDFLRAHNPADALTPSGAP
jgi:dipeptidyl aminopeptidase/acylaminoacyl peptidase